MEVLTAELRRPDHKGNARRRDTSRQAFFLPSPPVDSRLVSRVRGYGYKSPLDSNIQSTLFRRHRAT